MKTLLFAAVLGLALQPISLLAQSPKPINVFVTSVGAVNGMTDPSKDNADSVKDLRDSLKDHKKELLLVDRKEDAAIVLTVMGREQAQATAGVFGGVGRDCIIHVKLNYKEVNADMSASAQGGTLSSGGAWGRAASKVASQVADWVKTNRASIGG